MTPKEVLMEFETSRTAPVGVRTAVQKSATVAAG